MATPQYIKDKVDALNCALKRVAKLSQEIESWVESKTDAETAQDFFYDARLDMPFEFDMYEVLEMLEEVTNQGK